VKANTTPSVDSLKIRIPMANVKVINKRILDYVIEVSASTGEVLSEEFKRDSMEVYDRGIKTRYAIVTQQRGSLKVGSFLTIILTSKMTASKSGYYEGITENTIGSIHSYLSDHKVCEFTLETLLQSEVTDIDIKKDFNSTEVEFGQLTDRLSKSTFCTMELGRGHDRYHNLKKEENGIQWATRKTKTPRTNPFIKLYSKNFDLINQSRRDRIDFVNHILDGDEGEGIFRIETTIKNKDHLSSFGLTDSTLRGILGLSKGTLMDMISTNLKKQVEPRGVTIEKVTCEGISPKDQETINSIMMGMHFELPYQSIRTILMSELEGANLSKRGSRLDSLYVDHIKGSNSDESTQEMEQYFNLIGWD
tara:strand:- start:67 stop:1155 length:1089 start_codon:yes stop_codon:yes gene_type:complete